MKAILTLALAAASLGAADLQPVIPADGPKPVGPYTPGILAGNYLYVSGQGARRPDGKFDETNEARVRQCFRNVEAIVKAAGLTMEHVVYTQVYLHKDISYELMSQVWNEVFPKNPPARATLGLHRMPTETTVEINAVAVKDLSMKKAVIPPGYPKNLNIAPGVLTPERLYLSGFLGRDVNTGKIPESPEAQVQLALDRMKQVLDSAGLTFQHVAFVNPYHTAAMPRRVLDKVYARHFEFGNTPARATIEVSFLPHGANVEFTAIAARNLADRKAVRPKNMAPSPTASPCVWAAEVFYCSAKAGFIPGKNGGIFADRVEDQVRQTMRNLLDGLEEAGLDFSHVVASNVYVDNLDEFSRMNAVYGKYFTATPPTRTTVAPLPPAERKRGPNDTYPRLEEISIVAVK
jgi:reactive intermediate/imine deaminase